MLYLNYLNIHKYSFELQMYINELKTQGNSVLKLHTGHFYRYEIAR